MSIYIFLYILVISFSIYIGILFYKKYKNLKWLSFLFFVILSSIWFVLYFLTYSLIDQKILLEISRFAYWISFLWIYILWIFLLNFDKSNIKNIYFKLLIKYISIFIFLFTILIFFSPYIIKWIYFNNNRGSYYEIFGFLYNFYLFLEVLMIFTFWVIVYKKYKKLQNINKIRYKYILFWLFIFISLWILFQWILPVYWIYYFEKEVPFYILPFLLAVWYSISRYSFIDISFRYKKIFSFFISLFLVLILFYIKQKLYFYTSLWFINYWWINYNFTIFDIFIWIILFVLINNFFLKILPWNAEYNKFINYLNELREKIPFIMDIDLLNKFLKKDIKLNFNIDYLNIKIFDEKFKNTELFKFFSKNTENDIFINDIVFLEENKYKFDINKIKKELNNNIAIIFPMKNNLNELIWFLELGFKPFNEQYYYEEIEIIKKFVKFLIWHLKYISIYNEINNLNVSLDKKIDEKTIEYNNLINKQKEFISIISHEIKTPIMVSSFQIENILDELNEEKVNKKNISKELNLLKEQIEKIVRLTKTIFSIEQYDLKKIKLYLEKIDLVSLIKSEANYIKNAFPDINLEFKSKLKSVFIEIDKVQFTQVISNLLNNSIKFIENKEARILIILKEEENCYVLNIEDNGIWFKNWEEKLIFTKYNTWKNKSIWLWMWLYLCNKIVKLHKWEIFASNSEKLWWAKFTIKLPKN